MNLCLGLALFTGVLAGPFRIADTGPYHHQVALRTAMAHDGRFAIAWLDSLQLADHVELNLCIRYFNKNGTPLTDVYKVKKVKEKSILKYNHIAMDTLGNSILIWTDYVGEPPDFLSYVRFQRFDTHGIPVDTAKTLNVPGTGSVKPISMNNRGVFVIVAVVASEFVELGTGIWVQRFNLEGEPIDTPFLTHEDLGDKRPLPDTVATGYPQAALNDEGILVVTWVRGVVTAHMQPRYQVFDADDNPIDWEALGHRVDNGDSLAGACVPKPFRLDNDRIAMFWHDYCYPWPTPSSPLLCRVFTNRGQNPQAIRPILSDSAYALLPDPRGQFSISFSSDERFAYTHNRTYAYIIDSLWPQSHMWEHQGGMLGKIVGNEAIRSTNLFEYTPPYGDDTVWSIIYETRFKYRLFQQSPVVAVSDDRIVWVYTRFQTDTVFEAYAIVSDWDMGVGVAEPVTPITHLEIANPIGSSITLRYSNFPNGFHASVYDATGRKVDELSDPNQSGALVWGSSQRPGVYFIVPHGEKASPSKVVLVKWSLPLPFLN